MGANDVCWEWQGAKRRGYGLFRSNGKPVQAHRVAFELSRGEFSSTLHVLHRCDNPPCCNPMHLFLGSPLNNAKDRGDKGRSARGERINLSKLTERQVLAIRSSTRIHRVLLAHRYGVNERTISDVWNRKTWTHL